MKNHVLTVFFLCGSYFSTAQNIIASLAADINAKFAPLKKTESEFYNIKFKLKITIKNLTINC